MNCCLSAEPRKFVGLAAAVTDGFAARASAYDRENTFPHRGYEDVREVEFSTSGPQTRRPGRETQRDPTGAASAGDGQWGDHIGRGRAHPAGQTASGRLVPHSQHSPEGHAAQGRRRLRHLVLVTNEIGLSNDVTDAGTQAVNVPDSGWKVLVQHFRRFHETGYSGRAKSIV